MLEVHAGDWKAGPAAVKVKFNGQLKKLILPKGWFRYEHIEPHQIASVEIVTQENETSVFGKAAWGAAGAVTLGGLGLLAGVLGGGNKNIITAVVKLTDGRSALISGKSKEMKLLISAGFS